jgi:DNA-binding beta-propeller fold protein YncE
MKATLYKILLIVVAMTVMAGCAATKTVALPQKRFFWPSEPEVPRIEWIATYFNDLDITKKSFMSEMFGEDAAVMFKRPVSVASDGEGHIVISDQEQGQVYFFDLNKHMASSLGGNSGAASFTLPSGVAVDGDGNFYVADTMSRKVYVVNGANEVLRVMDFSDRAKSIGSLAVDRSRARLFIPDAKAKQVLMYTLTGELKNTIEGKGSFSYPNAVAVASDGSLFIGDSFNACIVHMSADGKYIATIGSRGDSSGNLSLVTGVAVDSEDHIYVTDGRIHNMTIFDKEGNTLLTVGGQHSIASGNIGRGGFQIPQGITIDKNDRIYIADSFNRRIQILQYLNERYLRDFPIAKP